MSYAAAMQRFRSFGMPYQGPEGMYSFLGRSLKPHEKVIVCSSSNDPAGACAEIKGAVEALGAEPLIWGKDLRWKTLLRMTFESRAEIIIGSAKSILSLAKLAKVNQIPLNIYNAIVIGAEASEWMLSSIAKFLDCRVFRCRSHEDLVKEWLPDKQASDSADNKAGGNLADYLMRWGSILDCNVYRGVSGLVMEIVCFRGEKLPVLPGCAKLVLRNWNPETDEPLPVVSSDELTESH